MKIENSVMIINRGRIKYTSVVSYLSGTVIKILTQTDRNTNKIICVDSESVLEEDFNRGHLWKHQIPKN